MKKLLFVLAAVTTMVSCSKDQVVEELPKVPIAFSNTFVENSTKAIDATYNNNNLFESFNVYGTVKGNFTDATEVNIFNNVPVSKSVNENTWGYENNFTQYWVDDCIYNFAAVVYTDSDNDATNNNSVKIDNNGMPISINYNVGNQIDLLYAAADRSLVVTNENTTPDKSDVPFTFKHLLSKVHFTFKNTIKSNVEAVEGGNPAIKYSYRVSDINITNAVKTGSYTIANAENNPWGTTNWQSENLSTLDFGNASNVTDSEAEITAIDICSIGDTEASATSHYSRVLIPANYNTENKLNITFTAHLYLNGTKIQAKNHTINAEVEFKPGSAYNLIIELGNPGAPIKFSVSNIQTWGPSGEGVTSPENNTIYPTPSN